MNNGVPIEQLETLNKVLLDYSHQARSAFDRHDYVQATHLVREVLNIVPNHPIALSDLAIAVLRLGDYESAYQYFMQALEASGNNVSINLYDGLTEVCFYLKKVRDQKKYGRLAVEGRKKEVLNEPFLALPKKKAPAFNSNNPKENIISYSLFGSQVRYCEYAVLNAQRALKIFPEWRCRFYVDETVPRHVINRLIDLNAQVIFVTESMKQLPGRFWRFYVMDDPNVTYFLIRDADSILSYREKMAVEEWIDSGKWCHTMHDSKDHVELILAGMWGGCTGVIQNIEQRILEFIRSKRYMSLNVIDQHFLRFCIWSTVKQSVLIHDSQGYDAIGKKFNTQASILDRDLDKDFYVGRVEIKRQLLVRIQDKDAQIDVVTWVLTDEKGNEICNYDQVIAGSSEFNVLLPDTYVENVLQGKWSLITLAKKYS